MKNTKESIRQIMLTFVCGHKRLTRCFFKFSENELASNWVATTAFCDECKKHQEIKKIEWVSKDFTFTL